MISSLVGFVAFHELTRESNSPEVRDENTNTNILIYNIGMQESSTPNDYIHWKRFSLSKITILISFSGLSEGLVNASQLRHHATDLTPSISSSNSISDTVGCYMSSYMETTYQCVLVHSKLTLRGCSYIWWQDYSVHYLILSRLCAGVYVPSLRSYSHNRWLRASVA